MAAKFQDKVALVTGGSSGMGQATAIAFAREGAKVVIAADKNVKGGQETVKLIEKAGGEATFVKTDVSKSAEVEALVNKTIEAYGRLDCAFNNAGISGSWQRLADCTEEEWDRTIGINLKGIWLCMKYEIIWMLKHGGGVIVNTASVGGVKAIPTNADYSASKFGVVGLTQSAALAYAKDGIRINVVCPGLIDTPMTQRTTAQATGGEPPEKMLPFGRMGTSEEIAEAVVWLCSDAASYVTGLAMTVDGGLAL
jgi:NAD(P)-dependent dehydrogenase (short-subunit alcohol dehydrogenase family)